MFQKPFLLPVPKAFLFDVRSVSRLQKWAFLCFVLPLVLFVVLALLLAQPTAQVTRIASVGLWQEPLGAVEFNANYFPQMLQTAPDMARTQWETISLPHSVALGPAVDISGTAPRMRAWFQVQVPPDLQPTQQAQARLAIMGNRLITGGNVAGPWAVWADGQLIQTNLADWRISWNVPLRVTLPLGVKEVLIAMPYLQPQGYGMGSVFIGTVDDIDLLWNKRYFWQIEAPMAASLVALVLLIISLPLALGRRSETMFALLAMNAVILFATNIQYVHDFTGFDRVSRWYAFVVDSTIDWSGVFTVLFAFEYQRLAVPRWRTAILAYASTVTVLTLPVWNWGFNGMVLQYSCTVTILFISLLILARHVFQAPSREGVLLLAAIGSQIPLAVVSIATVTNHSEPDYVHLYPFAVLGVLAAFTYAISRRTTQALNTAERYQADLEAQLVLQKQQLAAQHEQLRQLELEKQLAAQRETMQQDLHDGLGSNLVSALEQARHGKLSQDTTVLLLQDLTDELRSMSQSAHQHHAQHIHQILAALRQRVQRRLNHIGIELVWRVSPNLLSGCAVNATTAQHLRYMLNEAIANTIKHAKASQITLSATQEGQQITIEIGDNGQGFTPQSAPTGRGLPGMHDRAAKIGGELTISATPGEGTFWRLVLGLIQIK